MVASLRLSCESARAKPIATSYAECSLSVQAKVLETVSSENVQILSGVVIGTRVERVTIEDSEPACDVVVDCSTRGRGWKLL